MCAVFGIDFRLRTLHSQRAMHVSRFRSFTMPSDTYCVLDNHRHDQVHIKPLYDRCYQSVLQRLTLEGIQISRSGKLTLTPRTAFFFWRLSSTLRSSMTCPLSIMLRSCNRSRYTVRCLVSSVVIGRRGPRPAWLSKALYPQFLGRRGVCAHNRKCSWIWFIRLKAARSENP